MAVVELVYKIPVVVQVDTDETDCPVQRVTVCDEEIEAALDAVPDSVNREEGVSEDTVHEAIRLARQNTEWPAWRFGF